MHPYRLAIPDKHQTNALRVEVFSPTPRCMLQPRTEQGERFTKMEAYKYIWFAERYPHNFHGCYENRGCGFCDLMKVQFQSDFNDLISYG